MKTVVFAVRDVKAQAFLAPFFLPNEAMAIRSLEATMQDATTSIARFPQDYTLFRLGVFDDETGSMEVESPTEVIRALALIKKENADG